MGLTMRRYSKKGTRPETSFDELAQEHAWVGADPVTQPVPQLPPAPEQGIHQALPTAGSPAIDELNHSRHQANDAGILANNSFNQAISTHTSYAIALSTNAHALAMWGIALSLAQALSQNPASSPIEKSAGAAALDEARAATAGLVLQKNTLEAAATMPGAAMGSGSWWPLGIAAGIAYFLWRLVRR